MVLVKIIKSYREIIAICDSDLLGKKFEEGKFQLDVKESFFGGDETNEEKAIEIMNIIGKKSVNIALKAGIIKKEGIGKIDNIPFALILL